MDPTTCSSSNFNLTRSARSFGYPQTGAPGPPGTNERRSSLPAEQASQAASSEGLRSILSLPKQF
eukprot:3269462-Rhodomonas_salina.1